MQPSSPKSEKIFSNEIDEKEKLKIHAKKNGQRSVWSGLGLFGMVGWSVAVPTLIGTALGVWLDKKYPQSFSLTLSLLLIGLMSGCLFAWNWVSKENKQMHKNEENKNE